MENTQTQEQEKVADISRNLRESQIAGTRSKPGKFFESPDMPGKILRFESMQELSTKHRQRFDREQMLEQARLLFTELNEVYHIPVSVRFSSGESPDGREGIYAVVDAYDGVSLDQAPNTPEVAEKVERLYASIATYFVDKLRSGGLYVWDINGATQYLYGRAPGEKENGLHLIDTDVWLNNSREGMCLVVYWLMRHMGAREKQFGREFSAARKTITEFVRLARGFVTSDQALKALGAIAQYLAHERTDFNPDTAIPWFE